MFVHTSRLKCARHCTRATTTTAGATEVEAAEAEEDADAASGSDVSAGLSSSDDEGSTI